MNEAWSAECTMCVGRLGPDIQILQLILNNEIGSFYCSAKYLFSERFHFLSECVQFTAPDFPRKRKWVERGGNTTATTMNHCDARNINIIMKQLSSLAYDQSSVCDVVAIFLMHFLFI